MVLLTFDFPSLAVEAPSTRFCVAFARYRPTASVLRWPYWADDCDRRRGIVIGAVYIRVEIIGVVVILIEIDDVGAAARSWRLPLEWWLLALVVRGRGKRSGSSREVLGRPWRRLRGHEGRCRRSRCRRHSSNCRQEGYRVTVTRVLEVLWLVVVLLLLVVGAAGNRTSTTRQHRVGHPTMGICHGGG